MVVTLKLEITIEIFFKIKNYLKIFLFFFCFVLFSSLAVDNGQQILFDQAQQHSQNAKYTYRIELTDTHAATYSLRFNFNKCENRALKVMLSRYY